MDAQEALAQGQTLLWRGQIREAAAAFARAVQLAPDLVAGHLGLAQASLALESPGIAGMACKRVQELAPAGPQAQLAQAVLCVLACQYDRALEATEKAIAQDPAQGYAHALRGYCLRQLGRDYEASLAEAKAARQAGNVDLRLLFPKVAPAPHNPAKAPALKSSILKERPQPAPSPQPTWRPPSPLRRRLVRFRFATRGYHLATITLIVLNVAVFLLHYAYPQLSSQWTQYNFLVRQGQYWRILTAMFLHAGIPHIALNMLSLYFIGRWVEELYGPLRFLLIYFLSGIAGGLLVLLLTPPFSGVLGASGAIFGIFGALGAFIWIKRRAAGSAWSNWVFWLLINLGYTYYNPGISLSGHIGGLALGLLLGVLLLPDFLVPVRARLRQGRRDLAITYALTYIGLALAAGVLLILLAVWLGHGR